MIKKSSFVGMMGENNESYLKLVRHKAIVNLFLRRVVRKPLDEMNSKLIWEAASQHIDFLIQKANDADYEISVDDILETTLLR